VGTVVPVSLCSVAEPHDRWAPLGGPPQQQRVSSGVDATAGAAGTLAITAGCGAARQVRDRFAQPGGTVLSTLSMSQCICRAAPDPPFRKRLLEAHLTRSAHGGHAHRHRKPTQPRNCWPTSRTHDRGTPPIPRISRGTSWAATVEMRPADAPPTQHDPLMADARSPRAASGNLTTPRMHAFRVRRRRVLRGTERGVVGDRRGCLCMGEAGPHRATRGHDAIRMGLHVMSNSLRSTSNSAVSTAARGFASWICALKMTGWTWPAASSVPWHCSSAGPAERAEVTVRTASGWLSTSKKSAERRCLSRCLFLVLSDRASKFDPARHRALRADGGLACHALECAAHGDRAPKLLDGESGV
jgi:hypothetical protein